MPSEPREDADFAIEAVELAGPPAAASAPSGASAAGPHADSTGRLRFAVPDAAAVAATEIDPEELPLFADEPAGVGLRAPASGSALGTAAPDAPPRSVREEALRGLAEAGGQTSLFDFGATDDLGLSDRSLARALQQRGAVSPTPAAAPAPPAPAPERPAEPLHAGFIVERAGRVQRVVPWEGAVLLVGRAPDCDVVLGASGVSRRHARFVREDGGFRVLDLGSANGVQVNGRRVESASLGVGDAVRIDEYVLTFVLDREPLTGVLSSAEWQPADDRSPTAYTAVGPEPIESRDLVLDRDAALEPEDADKEVEVAAFEHEAAGGVPGLEADAESTWRFEVALAKERLPAALRRALEEALDDGLVLPAQLRLVRARKGRSD